jgi:hypothetical protein
LSSWISLRLKREVIKQKAESDVSRGLLREGIDNVCGLRRIERLMQ